jgi:ubiquinone/menaquinone biosynthesis C-methylase UbiE
MASTTPPKGQIYDSVATDYDIIWNVPAVKILFALLDTTLRNLGPWDGASVIDMACGTGIGLREAKKLGCKKLVGIDISNEMLEVAKQTSPGEFELHHADCSKDMSSLGLEEGGFDLVIGMWLLNYPENRAGMEGMWRNIARYLKPGSGKFVGIIQNQEKVQPESMRDKMDVYGARETKVKELESGEGSVMHVEFDTEPKVEFDTFVLKKEILESEAEKAGMRNLRYVRAGDEVRKEVEGKSEEWWRELLDEYPNQVIIAEKA